MMIRKVSLAVLLVLLTSAAVAISAADGPVFTRAQLALAEQGVDQRLLRLWNDNSLSLVGATRAAYVPGFGLVLSAEINLVTPTGSLFGDAPTDKDKADLRRKKTDRLPILRSAMKEVMGSVAAAMTQVPANEQIAFSVILPRFNWESGIPKQVTMQATRQELLNARGAAAALDRAVRVMDTD